MSVDLQYLEVVVHCGDVATRWTAYPLAEWDNLNRDEWQG